MGREKLFLQTDFEIRIVKVKRGESKNTKMFILSFWI